MTLARLALIAGAVAILNGPALERRVLKLHIIKRAVLKPEQTQALIDAAAEKHNVRPALVKSIVAAESNFDATAVSRAGAIGLMQLMPETAEQFGADPTDPAQNIDAGTHYLRVLIERYRGRKDWLNRVIAAYNAGPAVVDRYRGIPPYRETRSYVARVRSFLKRFERS